MKITSGAEWSDNLANKDTAEYKELAATVEEDVSLGNLQVHYHQSVRIHNLYFGSAYKSLQEDGRDYTERGRAEAAPATTTATYAAAGRAPCAHF